MRILIIVGLYMLLLIAGCTKGNLSEQDTLLYDEINENGDNIVKLNQNLDVINGNIALINQNLVTINENLKVVNANCKQP